MGRLDWKQINRHISGAGAFTGSLNITGSSTFTGDQFFSGSLIPESLSSQNGIHDLGSQTSPWRDLFLTTASLKFVQDGNIVSSVSGEPNAIRVGNILITTSSLSIVEGTGDSLTVVQEIVSATVSSSGEVTATQQVTAPAGTVSSSAQIEAFGFITSSEGGGDQTLSFNSVSNNLTISNGNSVSLASLAGGGGVGGSSIWSTGSDYYFVNANLQVTGSINAKSITGSIAFDNLQNTPVIISSSDQIEALGFITGSNPNVISSSTQITNLGFISGSPDGTVSSSAQIQAVVTDAYISASAAASGFGTGGSGGSTDISDLNTFTGSIQGEVDSLKAVTGSYATTGSNTFSGDQTINGAIDATGAQSKVRFLYNSPSDLPDANTYHGMFAHVHSTGKGYFAHAGNWVELANANAFVANVDTGSLVKTNQTGSFITADQTGSFLTPDGTVSSSAQIQAVVTDNYISASAASSGFGSGVGGGGSTIYLSLIHI